GGLSIKSYRVQIGDSWTIPVVDVNPGKYTRVVVQLHDGGRATAASAIPSGQRTILVDPYYFGETKVGQRDFLWALLIGTVGERPLGIQASQIAAVARWLKDEKVGPLTLRSQGPRSGLVALAAAALERDAIAEVELHAALSSLKDVLTQNLTYE